MDRKPTPEETALAIRALRLLVGGLYVSVRFARDRDGGVYVVPEVRGARSADDLPEPPRPER